MLDFLVVGGGIVGLSLAWELAQRNKTVGVVDRRALGTSTSWGGAGILPPPRVGATSEPLEALRADSHRRHMEWSERLREEVGIDNQLRRCGGIYFARSTGESIALQAEMQQARQEGVCCEQLSIEQLLDREPSLQSIAGKIGIAYELPDEMQIRAPQHLRALIAVCEKLGVQLLSDVDVSEFETASDTIISARTQAAPLKARHFCVCSGAWSAKLMGKLGVALAVEPWRGQLLIWQTPQPMFSRVINEGLRYFVPRQDGVLLAGATVEDVGFDLRTTQDAMDELTEFSVQILPELAGRKPKRAWSGLRPKTPDGCPYMGRVPGFANLSVCAGHFRSGLHVSPASAVFMAQLLLDDTPPFDVSPFRVQR